MKESSAFKPERQRMVKQQIERRGIRDKRLLDALRQVPRHLFVEKHQHSLAYEDFPLRIGQGQTISQPYIVALMTDLLQLKGDETVLEVGTGSGYQAAVLALMTKKVHTIERHTRLAENARSVLKSLHLSNVSVHIGDGSLGWLENAPYDGILVTCAAPSPPRPLLDQLADGGSMVIPVGDRYMQELQVWTRSEDDFQRKNNIPVAFVPLRGEHGWGEKDW